MKNHHPIGMSPGDDSTSTGRSATAARAAKGARAARARDDDDEGDGDGEREASDGAILLRHLRQHRIIHPEEWGMLSEDTRDRISAIENKHALLKSLTDWKLLNPYQLSRIQSNTFRGLVLGNYRILGLIGSGGIGIIFEAEHVLMRRRVAVKVLPIDTASQADLVTRFLREIRSVARLSHPNIVVAFDAGVTPSTHPLEEDLYYFVMEHLSGRDLAKHVEAGPMPIGEACTLTYQIASALDEAHRHLLVHRDIKPPNIFVTTDGQAKLLDFGLVRHQPGAAITTPGLPLGTLDYMAPEQALDPTGVDIRTDIYSLGATLFFALTSRNPFPNDNSWMETVQRRQTQQPVSARSVRADIPEELDKVILRMLALSPGDRFASPQAVMLALLPFLESAGQVRIGRAIPVGEVPQLNASGAPARADVGRVVVADADRNLRGQLLRTLLCNGFDCLEAGDGDEVFALLRAEPVEALLLAVDLPGVGGRTLLKTLRENPPCRNLKIIMTTPTYAADDAAGLLLAGADDCFCLPLSGIQLIARVRAAIRDKHILDRSARLSQQLLALNLELEQGLHSKTTDFVQARNALVLALARLVEYRSTETMAHLARMQRYCVTLAQAAAANLEGAGMIDEDFVQTIECCAPLHDIGNVGLPDRIVLKVGRLDDEERLVMQTHTTIGAETLQEVAQSVGPQLGFICMAIDIARHHHENFDGSGYPDGLAGAQIPLAARILAIADAYDALRSRRLQRQGLPHASALQIVCESSPGKYDPALLSVFRQCAAQFERIFRDIPDSLTFD